MPRTKQDKKDRLRRLSTIRGIADVLAYAGDVPSERSAKGPYGARLSEAFAMMFANGLRPTFDGILPKADGTGQESRARTGKGFKKLDVNYSTVELGLGLGVSIKTVNYRDPETLRYTKNYSRVDNELRSEAMDYHERQPYSVLAAVLLLPLDSCNDASHASGEETHTSSFGAAIKYFSNRTPRTSPRDLPDKFERFFVGLYDVAQSSLVFYDVARPKPPKARAPALDEVLSFESVLAEIVNTYDRRNKPIFEFS